MRICAVTRHIRIHPLWLFPATPHAAWKTRTKERPSRFTPRDTDAHVVWLNEIHLHIQTYPHNLPHTLTHTLSLALSPFLTRTHTFHFSCTQTNWFLGRAAIHIWMVLGSSVLGFLGRCCFWSHKQAPITFVRGGSRFPSTTTVKDNGACSSFGQKPSSWSPRLLVEAPSLGFGKHDYSRSKKIDCLLCSLRTPLKKASVPHDWGSRVTQETQKKGVGPKNDQYNL